MIYALVVVAAFMFGMYNVFIKLSSSHIDAVLGAVVLPFIAALIGLALLIYMKINGSHIFSTPKGIGLAVGAGVAIGLVEILTFFIYGRGLEVSVGNPLIIGGSLVVTTAAGVLFMREDINAMQLVAIALIAAGVALMAWAAGR